MSFHKWRCQAAFELMTDIGRKLLPYFFFIVLPQCAVRMDALSAKGMSVDKSIEAFGEEGKFVMTNLVFRMLLTIVSVSSLKTVL